MMMAVSFCVLCSIRGYVDDNQLESTGSGKVLTQVDISEASMTGNYWILVIF